MRHIPKNVQENKHGKLKVGCNDTLVTFSITVFSGYRKRQTAGSHVTMRCGHVWSSQPGFSTPRNSVATVKLCNARFSNKFCTRNIAQVCKWFPIVLSPGQTDLQVVASGRKLNLRRDLRWVAKQTRKFPRKYTQVA